MARSLSLADLTVLSGVWVDFDLNRKREMWKDILLEFALNEDKAVEKRKQLSAMTKEFKGLDEKEQLAKLGGLLKNYQEEIDKVWFLKGLADYAADKTGQVGGDEIR